MKLSVFTTITDPDERGDCWRPALQNYADLGDELVVVNGGHEFALPHNPKIINSKWPKEFNWKLFGEQFQKGYEACTGDWVLRADLDYYFHENDFMFIRQAIEDNPYAVGLSFFKYQFILPDRYLIKSRLVVLVNKKEYGDRIRFDGGGDMCQATFDGEWIDPQTVPEIRIPIYNYEKLLKTKEQIANDVGRMERAWKRYYGSTQYKSDGTGESALNKWIEAQKGKFSKPQKHIELDSHPKYIQETIRNLKPENWGYNGFGHLEGNTYV